MSIADGPSGSIDGFSVESVYAELLSRAPENKMEPRMAPLFRAMEVLGEPNKAFPIIHITGTNGKTSTARMIEAGLRAYGLRTGRYTSPHLSKVTERISIDGEPVSDETFVRIWDEIHPYLDIVDGELTAAGEPRLTYFECRDHPGVRRLRRRTRGRGSHRGGPGRHHRRHQRGRRTVSVVTPISLDHTELLGDDVADIALEKAGIIKERRLPDQRRPAGGSGAGTAGKGPRSGDAVPLRRRGIRRRVPDHGSGRADAHHRTAWPAVTRTCCCRCTASTRRRTPPSPSLPWKPSSGAATKELDAELLRTGFSDRHLARAASKWCAPRPPSWWTPPTIRPASRQRRGRAGGLQLHLAGRGGRDPGREGRGGNPDRTA